MSAGDVSDPLTLAAIDWLHTPAGAPFVREAVWDALRCQIDAAAWMRLRSEIREPRARRRPLATRRPFQGPPPPLAVLTETEASCLHRRAEAARRLVASDEMDAALALSLAVWPPAEVEQAEIEIDRAELEAA